MGEVIELARKRPRAAPDVVNGAYILTGEILSPEDARVLLNERGNAS